LALQFETVVEALYFEAKGASDTTAGITFIDDEGGEEVVSWLLALEEARGRAGALQRRGVVAREPVLVLVPTSSDFLFVFFGLVLAGAIPCPLSPPASFGDVQDFADRASKIARYLGARRVITTSGLRDLLDAGLGGVEVVLAEDLRVEAALHGPAYAPPDIRATDTAFIQCTSGSTGLSKGVMLSHENLVSNVHQLGWALEHRPGEVYVCWLPLYHDMGLIGCLLNALYWNFEAIFLSPFRFLRRPASWLQAIARHKGTMSTAPNFAYSYAASRVKDAEIAGVDLSSWRVAGCGAEPIDPRILLRFLERFKSFGLRENVFAPCYGLAEATVGVAFHPTGAPLEFDRVAREPLAERGEIVDVPDGAPGAIEIVSCGRPLPETRVRILDDEGRLLGENRVGRVQVAGPSVMQGYFALPEETRAVLKDGWLETGDLGYLRGGKIRITGRRKDLVVIRGRKYLPSDFEWAADDLPGVRRGNVVAFGLADAAQGTEVLCLVCETDLTDEGEREALRKTVKARVAERTGIAPAVVELVPRNTVPKTSSGKLQRAKTKALFRGWRAASGERPAAK
jgi:acyl-CoA synthetase (AMP-forming)/AMP-acid ligase II